MSFIQHKPHQIKMYLDVVIVHVNYLHLRARDGQSDDGSVALTHDIDASLRLYDHVFVKA